MEFLEEPSQPENELTHQEPSHPTERPWRAHRRGISEEVWDALSLLLLAATLLVLATAFVVFQNPYISINPYPPDTPIAPLIIPSATPIPTEVIRLPSTWTPTITLTSSATNTPTGTLTPTGTVTGTPPPATATLPNSAFKYLLRGQPSYLAGTVMHPDESCKLWVAGQAYDLKGSPVIGITVEMGGTLDNKQVYLLSLTGTALQYGPGGYEFVLADQALQSKGSVWVQLLDQELNPLSNRVFFDTSNSCDKNLILINFKQVR